MPARKTKTQKSTKKRTSASKKRIGSFNFQNLVKGSESYKSLIYGIITVVVLVIVIFLGVRALSQNKADIGKNGANTGKQAQESSKNMYTVAQGDTLWSIAEKEYGDGFKWGIIAKANNITNASSLEKGTKLTIPELTPTPTVTAVPTVTKVPTVSPAVTGTTEQGNMSTTQKITGDNYTVVHGDYLWEIAVRAYGDGYRWVDIAKANNLSNPNLIFSGNVLKLPRP